ncbi:MAG: DNA (cytosine-5-)-methyltransferase [Candidatus Brocadiae bacterium]|nr:DNA (cytosine-5-)-methyltransferase [Candidatus Brocadiia bacterium]
MPLNFIGLFSGAGGLDLGFENAGFHHTLSMDIDPWSVHTLSDNRPSWVVKECDIKEVSPSDLPTSDVFLAGFPCQGFSLGGNRKENDDRNFLFKEVVRLAKAKKPRYIVIENVLNLRTMNEPVSSKPFVEIIADSFQSIGYHVEHHIFKVSGYGVPQTRRRFIFIASYDPFPVSFQWPMAEKDTVASNFLGDIVRNNIVSLPNHSPKWGFDSQVHVETKAPFDPNETPVPCRLSRTGSDGHPIRSLDAPFPAVDTATIWGWAQGNVKAERKQKDRNNSKFVRNPNSNITLWRISASRLRSFTDREYARLQTFPDTWVFHGGNKRHIHKQIGNAVPVEFAFRIAKFLSSLYDSQTKGEKMCRDSCKKDVQMEFSF